MVANRQPQLSPIPGDIFRLAVDLTVLEMSISKTLQDVLSEASL